MEARIPIAIGAQINTILCVPCDHSAFSAVKNAETAKCAEIFGHNEAHPSIKLRTHNVVYFVSSPCTLNKLCVLRGKKNLTTGARIPIAIGTRRNTKLVGEKANTFAT